MGECDAVQREVGMDMKRITLEKGSRTSGYSRILHAREFLAEVSRTGTLGVPCLIPNTEQQL